MVVEGFCDKALDALFLCYRFAMALSLALRSMHQGMQLLPAAARWSWVTLRMCASACSDQIGGR